MHGDPNDRLTYQVNSFWEILFSSPWALIADIFFLAAIIFFMGQFPSIKPLENDITKCLPLMLSRSVLGTLCLILDQRPLSSFGAAIERVLLFTPTIFPIIYASIMGRFFRVWGLFKAERGVTLGVRWPAGFEVYQLIEEDSRKDYRLPITGKCSRKASGHQAD